ncbi:hypothetical protein RND81_05G233100 [Saponaria officinalis]|uniref:Uncharacterized protein n=1 Tax=Saponaria officinalis TaxID=3572 RepID=A0AAW1L175_SAPOF
MEVLLTFSILITLLSLLDINVEAQNPPFNSIYQFGDSISDTGNDFHLKGGCSVSPYGTTFFKRPTGRCSNGLLIVDYFAQAFKIPFLNPYLNKDGDFSHGANFAVAGATALTTSKTSLLNQVIWFKSLLPQICANQAACKQKLGNALFLVGEIGGNDYNGVSFGGGANPEKLRGLVPQVIQVISSVVKQLIDLGATKLVVPGNFPVGCMTIYLAAYKSSDPNAYDELGCLKNWNDLASHHNSQLQEAIKTLQQQHGDVKIVYADYFSALQSIFRNAASLGFDKNEMHKACCGGGNNNEYNFGGPFCGSAGANVCPNPDARVSWDGIHLTQRVYQLMADQLLKQFLPHLV